jgi:hypothetical protein
MDPSPYDPVGQPRVTVSRYNQRMANRVARRAHLNEPAVAVAFTFNNLLTMLIFGVIEDVAKLIPTVGGLLELATSLFSFYFHRIVIVTTERVYVYRDWPFPYPGKRLAAYERGPGVVRIGSDRQNWWSHMIRRGQLTFQDGTVVYHGILWIRRAQYVAQEANISMGGYGAGYGIPQLPVPGVPATSAPAPGWYQDPSGTAGLRWWDGITWTDHTHAS